MFRRSRKNYDGIWFSYNIFNGIRYLEVRTTSVSALVYLLCLALPGSYYAYLWTRCVSVMSWHILIVNLDSCEKSYLTWGATSKSWPLSLFFLPLWMWRNQSLKYPRDEKRGTKACNLETQIFMPLGLSGWSPHNSACQMEWHCCLLVEIACMTQGLAKSS